MRLFLGESKQIQPLLSLDMLKNLSGVQYSCRIEEVFHLFHQTDGEINAVCLLLARSRLQAEFW